MPRGIKSIETKHHQERNALFAGLSRLSRRSFFKVAGASAAAVAAQGLVWPRSFQPIEIALERNAVLHAIDQSSAFRLLRRRDISNLANADERIRMTRDLTIEIQHAANRFHKCRLG